MVDAIETAAVGEVAATATPEPKKTRAPRRKKEVVEATVSAPADAAVKTPKVRKKRAAKAEAAPAVSEASTKVTRARKTRVAKPTKAVAAVASDDISDLLKLEEENKSLRKALADKLRSENADLRKRLGHA